MHYACPHLECCDISGWRSVWSKKWSRKWCCDDPALNVEALMWWHHQNPFQQAIELLLAPLHPITVLESLRGKQLTNRYTSSCWIVCAHTQASWHSNTNGHRAGSPMQALITIGDPQVQKFDNSASVSKALLKLWNSSLLEASMVKSFTPVLHGCLVRLSFSNMFSSMNIWDLPQLKSLCFQGYPASSR